MAVQNSLTKNASPAGKMQFQQFLKAPAVLHNITTTLGDEAKKTKFVSSLISAVSTNPALQDCDYPTIVSAALLGEALNLSPSPQLGHYYMVPFNDTKNNRKVATFQLGYKGYVQLAIRSGQYKKINVVAVKEGELVRFDPLTEDIEINLIEDDEIRENTPTVGYYAMFELINGFRKAIYWSKKKMLVHADKYSKAFSLNASTGKYPKVSFADFEAGKVADKDMWLYSSFWYKDFDGMAFKTMLRQLISKWGIMSIELQSAFENDMSYKAEVNEQPTYFDNVSEADYTETQNPIPNEEPTYQPHDENGEPTLL